MGKSILVFAAWWGFAWASLGFAGSGPAILNPPAYESPAKDDRSWKNYYNQQGGYCVDYPSRWLTGEALDGAGFVLIPAPSRHSSSVAEIDGAMLPLDAAGSTLLEEGQLHLKDRNKFGLAEKIELVDQHETSLFGAPALFLRDIYVDPQSRREMVDEIVFATHGGVLYRLELATRADELKRFDAVFQHLVNSFRFDCPAHAVPRNFAGVRKKDDEAVVSARHGLMR
jgi:hypothetical protein